MVDWKEISFNKFKIKNMNKDKLKEGLRMMKVLGRGKWKVKERVTKLHQLLQKNLRFVLNNMI